LLNESPSQHSLVAHPPTATFISSGVQLFQFPAIMTQQQHPGNQAMQIMSFIFSHSEQRSSRSERGGSWGRMINSVCAQMLNNSPPDNLPVCAPPSYLKLGACLRLSARERGLNLLPMGSAAGISGRR